SAFLRCVFPPSTPNLPPPLRVRSCMDLRPRAQSRHKFLLPGNGSRRVSCFPRAWDMQPTKFALHLRQHSIEFGPFRGGDVRVTALMHRPRERVLSTYSSPIAIA